MNQMKFYIPSSLSRPPYRMETCGNQPLDDSCCDIRRLVLCLISMNAADGVPAPSGVTNPNQCYNNVGDEYVFCPGNCARSAGLASCAGIPPGRTVDPVIQAPGSVTFPMWAINSFHNPVNCKAPCTVTWVWGDANPHAIAGKGPQVLAIRLRTSLNVLR